MTEPPSAPSTSNAHTGERNQAEPRARNAGGLGVPCSRGRFSPMCGAPPTLGLWGSLGSRPRFALQPAQHAWHEDGRCITVALDVRVLRTSPITGRSWEPGGSHVFHTGMRSRSRTGDFRSRKRAARGCGCSQLQDPRCFAGPRSMQGTKLQGAKQKPQGGICDGSKKKKKNQAGSLFSQDRQPSSSKSARKQVAASLIL